MRNSERKDSEDIKSQTSTYKSPASQTKHLLLDFRMDYVEQHLKELQQQIAASARDLNALRGLMQEFKDMQEIRNNLAKQLGSNVIV